jgi:RNA recognition motif-containing protein
MYPRMEKESHRPAYRGENDCKVFLGGLNPRWSEEELGQYMLNYGRVISVSIARKSTGESKGYGFVTFRTPQEAAGSFGTVILGGKYVDIKPSINQQNDSIVSTGQFSKAGFRQPKDKKVIANLNSAQQIDHIINSPSQKASSKLSKHSMLFESQLSSSKKLEPEDGLQVNIIEVQGSQSSQSSSSSQKTTDHSGGVVGKSKTAKPLDRQGGISKLSKEYHPVIPLDARSLPISYNSMVPVGFGFMGPSYVSYTPVGSGQEFDRSPLHNHDVGVVRSAPDLRIKFFTFPGRD